MANVARGAGTSAYSFVQVPETFVHLSMTIKCGGATSYILIANPKFL